MVTTVELIRRGAERFADRTAVIFGTERLTFREVNEAANRIANTLLSHGAQKGDHIAILAGNGLWTISVDFACVKAGLVRVPLNSRLSAAEHRQMIDDTHATWLIHAEEFTDRAEELIALAPDLKAAGVEQSGAGNGPKTLDLSAPAEEPAVTVTEDDPLLLLFTSGTTGTLKSVIHTQKSYAAICANILANLLQPERDSVMLHAASLIHASGTFVLPYWIRGGANAVLTDFRPDSFLQAITDYQVTETNVVPTMLGMLLRTAGDSDLSSLRRIIYGASPMPRPLIEQGIERFGPIFRQYYGQTEAPLVITVLDEADHADASLAGSCGHPSVDAQVRVVRDDGTEVSANEVGEIQVRAPFQMAGYFAADELNAEMHTADGWLRTRDMARKDHRGYLYLVDRLSDMIVTGGYNVYPREVEDALMSHPDVDECAVVGAPDEVWVEAVVAYVSLRDGAEAEEQELRDHVRAQIAGYKVPKSIRFVDTIPKSAVGKILRRSLRDPLWKEDA